MYCLRSSAGYSVLMSWHVMQAQEAAARGDGAQLVVALQGSDYRTFRRRRQIWLILMGVYLLFQIALIPVCITQSAGLSDEGGPPVVFMKCL